MTMLNRGFKYDLHTKHKDSLNNPGLTAEATILFRQ